MYEADQSIDPPTTAKIVRRAMTVGAVQSQRVLLGRNSVSIAKGRIILLRSATSCRIRKRGKTLVTVMPLMLFLLLVIILIQEIV